MFFLEAMFQGWQRTHNVNENLSMYLWIGKNNYLKNLITHQTHKQQINIFLGGKKSTPFHKINIHVSACFIYGTMNYIVGAYLEMFIIVFACKVILEYEVIKMKNIFFYIETIIICIFLSRYM